MTMGSICLIYIGTLITIVAAVDDSEARYLPTDPLYQADCCGVIQMWKVYTTDTMAISLTTFTEDTSTGYRQLAQDHMTLFSGESEKTTMIPKYRQISVKRGDRIGWAWGGNSTMGYVKDGSGYPVLDLRNGTDWNSATEIPGRRYAVVATIKAGEPLVLHQLNETIVWREENMKVGNVAHRIVVQDVNTYGTVELQGLEEVKEYFNLVQEQRSGGDWVGNPYRIRVDISKIPPPGLYTTTVEVLGSCGHLIYLGFLTFIIYPSTLTALPTIHLVEDGAVPLPAGCQATLTDESSTGEVYSQFLDGTIEMTGQMLQLEQTCRTEKGMEDIGTFFLYLLKQRVMEDRQADLNLNPVRIVKKRFAYKLGTEDLTIILYKVRNFPSATYTQYPPGTENYIYFNPSGMYLDYKEYLCFYTSCKMFTP